MTALDTTSLDQRSPYRQLLVGWIACEGTDTTTGQRAARAIVAVVDADGGLVANRFRGACAQCELTGAGKAECGVSTRVGRDGCGYARDRRPDRR